MNTPTSQLETIREQLAAVTAGNSITGLSGDDLLRVTGAIEQAGRLVDALRVTAAAEIGHRSRYELGSAGLSAQKGCRNAADLIERVTRVSGRTAAGRIVVGEQLRPHSSLTGDELPARFPAVAAALTGGALGVDAASAIVTCLLPALPTAGFSALQGAEHQLVAAATGAGADTPVPEGADEIRRQGQVWQSVLDQDGARPSEERVLAKRGFGRGAARDGLMVGRYALAPDVYAKLQRVFDAYILTRTAPRFFTDEELAAHQCERDDRSWQQQRHDVFATIIDVISRSRDVPTIGGAPPTVVVSVRAEDLDTNHGTGRAAGRGAGQGAGQAAGRGAGGGAGQGGGGAGQRGGQRGGGGGGHIDGLDIPVSLRTVKQYACTGGTQQVLIGANGAVVALGTEQRLFNRQQRRAINLRDGTCIIPGCTIPAYWSEIHHVIPDSQGGPTHTNNGVSLCWYHHRTIDTSGWQIRMIDGAPQVKAPRWLETNAKWRPAGTSPTQLTRTLEQRATRPPEKPSTDPPTRPAPRPPEQTEPRAPGNSEP
ncbi:HNH endonuclease signature motif containing protein [Homoserinimonas sp. OAct 916]|uniref:HNH endonuclease signature motif containing protein n=1 Tax=Homoserinimonas sp. OAct 916 TaxID=2211450 RepID=UPI000DBE432E|nr:HNH endonuclease signature motif containing protein [Homoserinimonas sp. OAct 916]